MDALVPFDQRHLTKVKYHVWYVPINIAILFENKILSSNESSYVSFRCAFFFSFFLTKINDLVLFLSQILLWIYNDDINDIGDENETELNETKRNDDYNIGKLFRSIH
jgi:hypothetical protein